VQKGRWTSYGDTRGRGRNSNAGQGVASWIGSKGHLLGDVHRFLNSDGEISHMETRRSWTSHQRQ
jgi:hypothetical protein